MRRQHKSIHSNKAFSLLSAVMLSMSVIIVCCAFFSVVTFFTESMKFSVFFAAASMITGCYAGNFICGKYRRRMGLVYGTAAGIIIYLLMSAAGMFFIGNIPDIKKLLLLAFSGAAGGVSGVNSKRPKNLMD